MGGHFMQHAYMAPYFDPTTDAYWRHESRHGGPIYPNTFFPEAYSELYLQSKFDDDDDMKSNRNDESEPLKKKRGRKPKSYYKQLEEE